MAAIASRTDTRNSSADTESPSMRLIEFAKLFKLVTDVLGSILVKKSVLIAKDMNSRYLFTNIFYIGFYREGLNRLWEVF